MNEKDVIKELLEEFDVLLKQRSEICKILFEIDTKLNINQIKREEIYNNDKLRRLNKHEKVF